MGILQRIFCLRLPEHHNQDLKGVSETSPRDRAYPGEHHIRNGSVPDPQTAALLLGEVAGTAQEDLLMDAIGGAAALVAEAVARAGGVTRDQTMAIGILAARKANEAARAAGHAYARRSRMAQKAAMLAAMVGQGCHQHGEPDAAKKAFDIVVEELCKPESEPADHEPPDKAAERVVVGTCEACNRPLRVKRRGVRTAMRLTCKCGHLNIVHRGAEEQGSDSGA